MNNEQFLKIYLHTPQDFDNEGTYQCVDLAKLYAREVYGVQLGSFGGTALSGWKNLSQTFDPKIWERIDYRFPLVPKCGDIIFYDFPAPTGHVAIVQSADIKGMVIMEQNGATSDGKGIGNDAINLRTKRDYKRCVGWYRKK